MNQNLITAIEALKAVHAAFAAKTARAVANGYQREKAIGDALRAMAADFGLELGPVNIRSDGDIAITAVYGPANPQTYPATALKFGEFAKWLNVAKTRTGMQCYGYKAVLTPDANWCFINHFAAEKLVLAYYQNQMETNPCLDVVI